MRRKDAIGHSPGGPGGTVQDDIALPHKPRSRLKDQALEPQIVIHKEKSANRWVAEVVDMSAFLVPHAQEHQLWWGVFDSKEEAREAAQGELDKRR